MSTQTARLLLVYHGSMRLPTQTVMVKVSFRELPYVVVEGPGVFSWVTHELVPFGSLLVFCG